VVALIHSLQRQALANIVDHLENSEGNLFSQRVFVENCRKTVSDAGLTAFSRLITEVTAQVVRGKDRSFAGV
jgi:hypothetical protein